jgi:hypothetical protein
MPAWHSWLIVDDVLNEVPLPIRIDYTLRLSGRAQPAVVEYISSKIIFVTLPILSATASLGTRSVAKSSGNLDVHLCTAPYDLIRITGAQILFTTSIIKKMGYQSPQGSQSNPRAQCTCGGAY